MAPRPTVVIRTIDRLACFGLIASVAVACGTAPVPSGSEARSSSPRPAVSPTGGIASGSPSAATLDGWTLVDVPEPGTWYADIAATPSLLAVVGTTGPAGQAPLAWTSADGEVWSVEHLGADGPTPQTAVAWGDRLLVVGAGQSSRCAHPAALDSWLRDADGRWSEAPWDELFCVGGTSAVAVAADHVLRVGSGTGDVPFLWGSRDGLRWTASPIGFGAGAPQAAATIAGTDLVFGTRPGGAWVSRSTDGLTWSPLTSLGTSPTADVIAAVPLGGRLAVVLRDSTGAVGTLSTADGQTWTSAPAVGLEGRSVAKVVGAGDGLAAIGGDEAGPRLWISADGGTWRPVALPAEAGRATSTLTGATTYAGRAWLVGQMEVGGHSVGAVWVGPEALLRP